jgi:hypothetical protein
MIETFEARQLFSATLALTSVQATDPAAEPPPVTVDADAATAKKKGATKASFQDFSFTHFVDKASPVLMQAC